MDMKMAVAGGQWTAIHTANFLVEQIGLLTSERYIKLEILISQIVRVAD